MSDPELILVADVRGLAGSAPELDALIAELAVASRTEDGPLLARPSDVTVHRIAETVHTRDPNPPDPGMFG